MDKLDLSKKDSAYYKAKKEPAIHTFTDYPYLTIEGQGAPGGENFVETIGALYPLAYGIKKIYKLASKDFVVPKLEGLWWVEGDTPALQVPREQWQWKLMIRMPDFVTPKSVEIAREDVIRKKKIELIKDIQFERMNEGQCVQILHVGPYSTEPETLSKLNQYLMENKLEENGLHHEIYLSDPRKVEADKLKTIIRYPVK